MQAVGSNGPRLSTWPQLSELLSAYLISLPSTKFIGGFAFGVEGTGCERMYVCGPLGDLIGERLGYASGPFRIQISFRGGETDGASSLCILLLFDCVSIIDWLVWGGPPLEVEESEACFVVSPCVLADEDSWRYFVVKFLFWRRLSIISWYVKGSITEVEEGDFASSAS